MELLTKLMNNSSKTSTVQIKRIKPSIIYRLLLIGLGTPMVIYGWFARSPSKRESKLLAKHAQKRTSVGVVWVIAHVGLKRKL
ncbi:hypothetical protein ACVXHB_10835 [Escherichia coli]